MADTGQVEDAFGVGVGYVEGCVGRSGQALDCYYCSFCVYSSLNCFQYLSMQAVVLRSSEILVGDILGVSSPLDCPEVTTLPSHYPIHALPTLIPLCFHLISFTVALTTPTYCVSSKKRSTMKLFRCLNPGVGVATR